MAAGSGIIVIAVEDQPLGVGAELVRGEAPGVLAVFDRNSKRDWSISKSASSCPVCFSAPAPQTVIPFRHPVHFHGSTTTE